MTTEFETEMVSSIPSVPQGSSPPRRGIWRRRPVFVIVAILAVIAASIGGGVAVKRSLDSRRAQTERDKVAEEYNRRPDQILLSDLPVNVAKCISCPSVTVCDKGSVSIKCECDTGLAVFETDTESLNCDDERRELRISSAGFYVGGCVRVRNMSGTTDSMSITLGTATQGNDRVCNGTFKMRFSRIFRRTPQMFGALWQCIYGQCTSSYIDFPRCVYSSTRSTYRANVNCGTDICTVTYTQDRSGEAEIDFDSYNQGGCQDYPY